MICKSRFGLSAVVQESLDQALILTGKKSRSASFWENYCLSLRLLKA